MGIDGLMMEVEVDIASGLPAFTTVGLPEASVRESKERVKAAILNCGYGFPDDRITVNLAPAHIRKAGTGFDLPIAIGILAASGVLPGDDAARYVILGELALDGRVKPVFGALPMALAAKEAGFEGILVPAENAPEAAVVDNLSVYPVHTVSDAVAFLRKEKELFPEVCRAAAAFEAEDAPDADFSEVSGQMHVKRAMEIAAAGKHNLLMTGPPGSGKTMLAKRFPGIIPPMRFDEAMETTKVYSVAGMLPENRALMTRRPFRAPHHTISHAGLIGGGSNPRPGEVSLAHNGVLFLDELPEFKKTVLEVLRQPLEGRDVTISRASMSITYPAAFTLIAAMNPCPCGYLSDPKRECLCSPSQIQKYTSRMSGPLVDRIDLHVEVPNVEYGDIANGKPAESSAAIRKRVIAAARIQENRFPRSAISSNSEMGSRHIRKYCDVGDDSAHILQRAMEQLGLSARAYHRVLKIARTIADLAGEPGIGPDHVLEAIQYRSLDRKISGADRVYEAVAPYGTEKYSSA